MQGLTLLHHGALVSVGVSFLHTPKVPRIRHPANTMTRIGIAIISRGILFLNVFYVLGVRRMTSQVLATMFLNTLCIYILYNLYIISELTISIRTTIYIVTAI
jgi:hypothetical protein